jgi:hypothetical protein
LVALFQVEKLRSIPRKANINFVMFPHQLKNIFKSHVIQPQKFTNRLRFRSFESDSQNDSNNLFYYNSSKGSRMNFSAGYAYGPLLVLAGAMGTIGKICT